MLQGCRSVAFMYLWYINSVPPGFNSRKAYKLQGLEHSMNQNTNIKYLFLSSVIVVWSDWSSFFLFLFLLIDKLWFCLCSLQRKEHSFAFLFKVILLFSSSKFQNGGETQQHISNGGVDLILGLIHFFQRRAFTFQICLVGFSTEI